MGEGGSFVLSAANVYTELDGLRFSSAANMTSDFAVVASGPAASSSALLNNCHFVGRPNAIDNSASSGQKSMNLVLRGCSFRDTPVTTQQQTVGIRTYDGSVTMQDCFVRNYNVSTFLDGRDNSLVDWRDVRITSNHLDDPDGFNDFVFLSGGTSLVLKDVSLHSGNSFSNFVWQQQGASVVVESSDFYDNSPNPATLFHVTDSAESLTIRDSYLEGRGFALITASGQGPLVRVDNSILVVQERSNVSA